MTKLGGGLVEGSYVFIQVFKSPPFSLQNFEA